MATADAPIDDAPVSTLTVADLEPYRRQLTAYCYRMLGSGSEAEDAVQETLLKAWRALDRFEGRSSVRSWLYKIATNVCLDMLQGPQRRARPIDLGPSSPADAPLGAPIESARWVQPIPDAWVLDGHADPADVAAVRESIRFAFVAALQHLPARQRAVLILREVLRWPATEVAELLGSTVASVNSALQRARATLDAAELDEEAATPRPEPDHTALLAGFVDAFERYDVAGIVGLLRADVEFSMPPFPLWLRGGDDVARFLVGTGAHCAGSKLVPIGLNGQGGFACYHPNGDGTYSPWALQLLDVDGDRITSWTNFLGPELFERFGLPLTVDAEGNGIDGPATP